MLESQKRKEADLDEKITVCSNKYQLEFKGIFFNPYIYINFFYGQECKMPDQT